MRNYSWEYFNAQIKKLSEQNKPSTQSKIDVEPDFDFSLVHVRSRMNKPKNN